MMEVLKTLPRFFIETLKGMRKLAIYQESRFLEDRHRQIYFSQYKFEESILPHKIIVSFTTHKERIKYIHYTLDSLYTQTLRPDSVHLYVSEGEYSTYPTILERFKPWLKIIETKNIGSYKKFIPALMDAKEGELIVSLDDDFIYPSYLISDLYEAFLKKENALIGHCGFKNKQMFFNGIAGGMGILWNPKIFNPHTMPFFFDSKLFIDEIGRNYDDGWIALSCLEQGIEIFCLTEDYFAERKKFYELPSGKLYAISSSGKGSNHINKKEKELLREKTRRIIREHKLI